LIELCVVVLSYGKAELLRACLEALRHQTVQASEVIVVVCGASDATRAMLDSFVSRFRLRVIWQIGSSPGAARNRAVEATAAHYCLFLDDDVIADSRLVAEHLRVQRQGPGVAGLGQLIARLPPSADGFARYVAQEWDHHTRLQEGAQAPSCADCSSANLSVPRLALLKAGGFVDSSGAELGYRLERQGLSFVHIPEAIGHRDYRKGFREVATDAERAGAASIELYAQQPHMLPYLQLGAFYDMSRKAILLRRLLLTLGVPGRALAMAGLLLGKGSWAGAWYRFVHSYCYWRGVRRAVPDRDTWQRLTRSPVILMYHAFGKPGEPSSRYVIPGRRFARQMAWLKWRGYHVLGLEEFLRDRCEYRLPPARSVILTFDDGYADNRAVAYPILRRYGFPATIFLVSGGVGDVNRWDSDGELAGRPLLSWSDVRALLHGGVRFGAHTQSHVALTAVSPDRMKDEVEGSRAELERALGVPIFTFAYPHGELDAAVQAGVEDAGFLGACSCHTGVNDPIVPSHALRRVEVRGAGSFIRFALALWLGIPGQSQFYRRNGGQAQAGPRVRGALDKEATDGNQP